MVKRKQGPMARAARMMKLGAGLAGSYLAHQLGTPFASPRKLEEREEALRNKRARQVREGLQDLRGPIMKLGQVASMQGHLLDPAMLRELSTLQRQAPPMHPTLMRVQFKNALGREPEEIFQSFETEPAAAASLGQVHRAITRKGEKVAVKIQYPAMREAIQSDFRLLRTALLPARATGHIEAEAIREAERGILEEADYRKEAVNVGFFRKRLAPLPFVRVPRVWSEFSANHVLTLSWMEGAHLAEFLDSKPTQQVRDLVGERLMRLFFFQLFKVRALHADPHPGNYLFDPSGNIGLVDFGCVKYLAPEVVEGYRAFWQRDWVSNKTAFEHVIRILWGGVPSRGKGQMRPAMDHIRRFYDTLFPLDARSTPIDFGSPARASDLTELAKSILNNKLVAPGFIFLSRAESGLHSLLHALKSRVRTTQIVLEMME